MPAPKDLLPRLGVAVVGAPLALGAIWAGGWIMGAVVALLAALGAQEFYGLAAHRGERPFRLLGSAAVVVLVALATQDPTGSGLARGVLWTSLGLTGVALVASLRLRWPDGGPAGAVASTLAGLLYVGLPLAFLPLLRALPARIPAEAVDGVWRPMAFVLFPLLATWASDSAAYFVGNAVGRHKLAPAVSPGKSVEGAVGGIAGAMGAGALMASWWLADLPVLAVSPLAGAGIGAVISVTGQLGDLAESMLKREAGVKDSGRLLPGHGGILDRVDALLFAFPVMWVLLLWTGALVP